MRAPRKGIFCEITRTERARADRRRDREDEWRWLRPARRSRGRARMSTPRRSLGCVRLKYSASVSKNCIEAVQSRPGRLVTSVDMASYDAWIKQIAPTRTRRTRRSITTRRAPSSPFCSMRKSARPRVERRRSTTRCRRRFSDWRRERVHPAAVLPSDGGGGGRRSDGLFRRRPSPPKSWTIPRRSTTTACGSGRSTRAIRVRSWARRPETGGAASSSAGSGATRRRLTRAQRRRRDPGDRWRAGPRGRSRCAARAVSARRSRAVDGGPPGQVDIDRRHARRRSWPALAAGTAAGCDGGAESQRREVARAIGDCPCLQMSPVTSLDIW